MVKNQNLIPKTETVYELKNNEILGYEEFLKNYESDERVGDSYHLENHNQEKSYGPCINNKDCSCGYIIGKSVSAYDKNGVKWFTSEVGIDGSFPSEYIKWTEAGIRTSLLTLEDSDCSIRFASGNVGVCVGNGVGTETNINLFETDVGPVNASLGLSANTGVSVKDKSISLNVSGMGLTIGRKIAINTPFCSIGIDFGYFLNK